MQLLLRMLLELGRLRTLLDPVHLRFGCQDAARVNGFGQLRARPVSRSCPVVERREA
jgi:hypothetical protein